MAIRYPDRARVRHAHSSSRYDRSMRSLLRAVLWYVIGRDIITFTEMSSDTRARALQRILGWAYVQVGRGGGQDECALIYRRLRWRLVKARVSRLSENGIPTRGGQRIYSLDVTLEHRKTGQRIVVSVAHLPADVEGNWESRTANVTVYKECLDTWARMAKAWHSSTTIDGGGVLLVADWNLDWHKEWVRNLLRDVFGGLHWTWGGSRAPATGGTHGSRLIDYTVTDLMVYRARLMRDDDSSDHRPYAEVLLLPSTRIKES